MAGTSAILAPNVARERRDPAARNRCLQRTRRRGVHRLLPPGDRDPLGVRRGRRGGLPRTRWHEGVLSRLRGSLGRSGSRRARGLLRPRRVNTLLLRPCTGADGAAVPRSRCRAPWSRGTARTSWSTSGRTRTGRTPWRSWECPSRRWSGSSHDGVAEAGIDLRTGRCCYSRNAAAVRQLPRRTVLEADHEREEPQARRANSRQERLAERDHRPCSRFARFLRSEEAGDVARGYAAGTAKRPRIPST